MQKLIFAALGMALALPAQAAVTVFTTVGAFNTATQGQAAENSWFDPGTSIVVDPPIALGKALINAPQAALYDDHFDDYYNDAVYLGTSGDPDPANPTVDTLAAVLTITTTDAFLGLDLGSYFGTKQYVYSVNGVYDTLTVQQGVDTFIGATADGPITFNLFILADDEVDVIHTYTSGASVGGAVPEPASWMMMIGGFGLVGSALRRRRPAFAG